MELPSRLATPQTNHQLSLDTELRIQNSKYVVVFAIGRTTGAVFAEINAALAYKKPIIILYESAFESDIQIVGDDKRLVKFIPVGNSAKSSNMDEIAVFIKNEITNNDEERKKELSLLFLGIGLVGAALYSKNMKR